MEFDCTRTLFEQKDDFTALAGKHGRFMSSIFFYGKDHNWKPVRKDDIKKVNYAKIVELCSQSMNIGQTEALEVIYKNAKNLAESSLSKEEKFDLLFGDIEILLGTTANYFKENFDTENSMPFSTIESMRKTYGVLQ